MSGGGGIGQLLPLALGIGATIATGGAAAPMLGEALGAEAGTVGASMLGAGALGVGSSALGGLMQGQSGSDILKNSLLSGLLGAGTAGVMGSAGNLPVSDGSGSPIDTAPTYTNGAPQTASFDASGNIDQLNPNAWGSENAPTSNALADNNIVPKTTATDKLSNFLKNPYNYEQASNMQKFAPIVAGQLGTMFNQPTLTGITQPQYTGPLSLYKFDPNRYQPVMSPAFGYGPTSNMAEGGIAALAMGGQPGQNYPMAQQDHTVFATPNQMPTSAMAVRNFEPATNPLTGDTTQPMAMGGIASIPRYNGQQESQVTDPNYEAYINQMFAKNLNNLPQDMYPMSNPHAMASGGVSNLGSYSDGGRLLKGPGDGMSDNIPATISNKQPARLADGEFVVPADVVSHLGNGSTDAGAKHLYAMMDHVRKARTGNPKQGKQINASKFLPA